MCVCECRVHLNSTLTSNTHETEAGAQRRPLSGAGERTAERKRDPLVIG